MRKFLKDKMKETGDTFCCFSNMNTEFFKNHNQEE